MESSGFTEILRKELVELSQERVILFGLLVGPLLLYLVMGGILVLAAGAAERQVAVPLRIAVVGDPRDPAVARLAQLLGASVISDPNTTARFDAIIVLPEDFMDRLSRGARIDATVIVRADAPSIFYVGRAKMVVDRLEATLSSVLADLARECLPEASGSTLREPASVSFVYNYRGKLLSAQEYYGLVAASTLVIPLSMFVIALAATQVAAVSMGLEREARTLEKLVSLPVDYHAVVAGKVAAVTVLSLGGALSNLAGLLLYLALAARLARGLPENIAGGVQVEAHLELTPLGGIVLLVGTLLTLYITSLIGLIVGSAAEDVRGSQIIANIAAVILAFPLFFLMLGVSPCISGPLITLIIVSDPYAAAVLISGAAISGELLLGLMPLGILMLEAALLTLVAARLLDPEHILLGLPLRERLSSLIRGGR